MMIPQNILFEMYTTMVRIRQFEDTANLLFLGNKLPGTVHLYQGEEAVAAGVCANLRKDDVITSTHRPHGHAIAKGVSIKSCMAELFAKSTGCCRGKGGSMHLGDISVGMLPAIAIVGGGIPIATGCALAFKFQRKDNIAVAFFGDGASNEGAFHEALNIGAIWNLPVIYVCENNLYGASTHITKVMKVKNIVDRASSYGIAGVIADGNDVIEVYQVVKEAVEKARKGLGPTLIECKTYRKRGHSRSDANNYRNKDEEKEWLTKDPIIIVRTKLKEFGIKEEDLNKIDREVEGEIKEAIDFAEKSPYPVPEDCLRDVFVE